MASCCSRFHSFSGRDRNGPGACSVAIRSGKRCGGSHWIATSRPDPEGGVDIRSRNSRPSRFTGPSRASVPWRRLGLLQLVELDERLLRHGGLGRGHGQMIERRHSDLRCRRLHDVDHLRGSAGGGGRLPTFSDRRRLSLVRIVGLKNIRTCALAGPLELLAVQRRPTSGRQSYNAMPGGCPTARFAIGHRDLKRSVRMLKR